VKLARYVMSLANNAWQHLENLPLVEQGCASLAPSSADRTHRVVRRGRRFASSVRPNLSYLAHTPISKV
jgi:hypothetical protein